MGNIWICFDNVMMILLICHDDSSRKSDLVSKNLLCAKKKRSVGFCHFLSPLSAPYILEFLTKIFVTLSTVKYTSSFDLNKYSSSSFQILTSKNEECSRFWQFLRNYTLQLAAIHKICIRKASKGLFSRLGIT